MNTTYFLNCAAGNIFNTKTSPALPKTYYIGLSTSAPAINGTGVNEPSTDAGYARVKLSSLGEPVDGVVTNSQAINFNESTASWGTITHFVIYDSATVGEGNLLMYGTLSTPRSVETATIMTIKEGYLSLSAQNPTCKGVESHMPKEFDIYLNKRLTECDIIVYSIPFRDGLTATNRMILESCLESYTLQKFIAVETGSELVSHIDKMIKTCNERLHMASTWGIDLEFQTHYVLNPVPTVIEIAPNDDLQTLRNMFMSVEDKLQITAASIDAMVAKSLGEGGSRMNIDAEVRQSLKNSLLRPAAALPVDTKVRQISEQNFLTIDAPVEPSAEIVDLCYRFYTAAGTAMQIAAAVIETEIHFSLGSGESGIELSASADGTAKKYEAIQSTVEILAGITEKITQFMAPEKGGILLSAAATPILKRHRLLNEMDADTLLTYDDMALEDIDYIIL